MGRLLAVAFVLALAACAGHAPSTHWPKSAGAIAPDDPADDGGESLAPRALDEGAAAVEHGGDDVIDILDEPAAAEPAPPPSAPESPTAAAPAPPDDSTDTPPVFDEVIIVN